MDIRVGSSAPVGQPGDKTPNRPGTIEAKVLAVRGPRRRRGRGHSKGPERRRSVGQADPASGRVLVLLIPDGGQLPPGVATGAYRVFLRFVRR